jgi:RNA polymerase sigma-B factor
MNDTPSTSSGRESVATLLEEYARTRDLALRNRLVLMHERLARSIAARFGSTGGSSQEDLRQVAYLGIIAAIERYNPDTGVSFLSFAAVTVVGVIKHYLRDHGWLVKAPRRLRELGMSLRKTSARLEYELGRAPTIAELAEATGIDTERILEAMEIERSYQPISLDTHLRDESGEQTPSHFDALGGTDPGYHDVDERETVRWLLGHLDPREREIILQRFYGEASQAEVAARLDISQMHVSRLERRALKRLRALLA